MCFGIYTKKSVLNNRCDAHFYSSAKFNVVSGISGGFVGPLHLTKFCLSSMFARLRMIVWSK